MLELGFFALCGFAGMVPTLVALALKRPGMGAWLAAIWFAVSVMVLSVIGMGPHGFILFVFIPFWSGTIAALIWALARSRKGRSVA